MSFGSGAVLVLTVTLWASSTCAGCCWLCCCSQRFPWCVGTTLAPGTTLALCLGLHFLSVVGRACEAGSIHGFAMQELITAVLLRRRKSACASGLAASALGDCLSVYLASALAAYSHGRPVVLAEWSSMSRSIGHRMANAVAVPVATKFRIEPRNILRFLRYVQRDAPQLVILGIGLLAVLRKTWQSELCQDPAALLGARWARRLSSFPSGGDELSRGRFLIWPYACTCCVLVACRWRCGFPKAFAVA